MGVASSVALLANIVQIFPPIKWLVGQLSVTRPGRRIEQSIRDRLKWLKDPEADRAFRSALGTGVENYQQKRGHLKPAEGVATVFSHVVEHDMDGLSQAMILEQVFADEPDPDTFSRIVQRYANVLGGTRLLIPHEEISTELQVFVIDFLRPAFMAHSYFAERVGFAEVVGLLREILEAITGPSPDLEGLRRDYNVKMVRMYELITMQGISPKVRNRTIGIRMEDVFIPLEAQADSFGKRIDLGIFQRLSWIVSGHMPTIEARKAIIFSAFGDSPLTHLIDYSGSTDVFTFTLISQLIDFGEIAPRTHALLVLLGAIRRRVGTAIQREIDFLSERFIAQTYEFAGWSGLISIQRLLSFPRIVIQGDPGSGKSTITRYIVWAISAAKIERIGEEAATLLPLRIRAIEFGEALKQGRVDSLEEYLLDVTGRFAPLMNQALVSGEALILVDGLDEVGKPALRARVKERVDDFIADPIFSDNQLVITTRIVGYERSGIMGRFPHFTLAELSYGKIKGFVEDWYEAIYKEMPGAINVEAERDELLEAIENKEGIRRMARNPLLLTIIALIKWRGRTLPDQRVMLYDAATQTLIRSWPLLRQVELDEQFIREWLAPVAFHIFADQTSDLIDEYNLMDQLVASMCRLRSTTEIEAKAQSRKLLEDVSQHSGILLPRGTDEDGRVLYGFLHQTFTEYLAAYYLAGVWVDDELDLTQYAHDPYWREVLLLLAGHLGAQRRKNAGKFIKAIRELNSSSYEASINRDLLLAGRILCDGVPASPGELVETLLKELLELWLTTPLYPLRTNIESVFQDLSHTEYGGVLARLAGKPDLTANRKIILASLLGPEYFLDDLRDLLGAEAQSVRYRTARLLAEQNDPCGVDALIRFLRTEYSTSISLELERMLIDPDYPHRAGLLIKLLETGDSRLQSRAIREVVQRDDLHDVANMLVELLVSDNLSLRYEAAKALAQRDDPRGVSTLVELLEADDPNVCYKAAGTLAERGDPRGVDTLIDVLGVLDPHQRFDAARIVIKSGNPREVADTLADLLEADDSSLRDRAALLLLEQDDPRVVNILARAQEVENPNLYYEATSVLTELVQQEPSRVVNALVELLGAKDPGLRYGAASQLAQLDDPRAIETLGELLGTEDPELRYGAAVQLAQRGDPRAFETLDELLDAQDPYLGYRAASQLVQHDDPRAINTLTQLLEAEDPDLRYGAALQLARLNDPRAINMTIEILRTKSLILHQKASELLAREESIPGVIEKLAEMLEGERPILRFEVMNILAASDSTLAFNALEARLDTLLQDFSKPKYDYLPIPAEARSVADIAYKFILEHLSPTGELQFQPHEMQAG